jgi:23S rRNA pseudouridine955/2504/2580 synthase
VKNIDILYEDDFSIIVNKPAGLAVQGGKGVKTSLDMLLAEIRTPPPLLVHRLDKDTSGVLLAAKGREAAARFSSLLGRKAVKLYIAVCKGRPEKNEGVIKEELFIRGSMKKSETRYKLIKSGILSSVNLEYSVLELELGTGRMHQIRRHLAMTGNPVLGDDKYGDFTLNKHLKKAAGLKRLLLHASRLIIEEFNLDIHAPLPEYLKIFVISP